MASQIPGKTAASRERQMVGLAVDLAEKQLREGTASATVIQHYLKLGATDYQLRLEKLERENELLRARTDSIESSQESLEIAKNAMEAIKRYTGNYDVSMGNADEIL